MADEQQVCNEAFQSTQELRRAGKLVAARAQTVSCGQPQCHDIVASKCREWAAELDAAIPTIIVVARDPKGVDTADVRVSVDGALSSNELDGRPIALDPGPHQLLFEHGGKTVEQRVVLTEGQRGRRIEVSFGQQPQSAAASSARKTAAAIRPAAADEEDAAHDGLHPLAYAGFALAGAGALVGAIAGGVALSKGSDIDAACPDKRCTEAQRDTYDSGLALAHVSTVSFVVAGVGLSAGVIGVLLSDSSSGEASVEPLLGPGFIGIRGRM